MNNQPEDRLARAFDAARAAAEHVPGDDQRAGARAQFLLDAKGVSLNGDMRHRDQTGTLSDGSESTTGERRMNRTYKHARLLAAVMLGVILAGGFWVTPSLRALAQEIIDFIVLGSSDSVHERTWVSAPVYDQESVNPYPLTRDELIAEADFDVRLPTFLPTSYQFAGAATVGSSDPVALLSYQCQEAGSLGVIPWSVAILQRRSDDTIQSFEVGASAVIEPVAIHDAIGEYVRGTWHGVIPVEQIGSGGGEVDVQRQWINDTEFQYLKWQADGIFFTIRTSSGNALRVAEPLCALTKDDYVAIAEGLQPASMVAQ